MDDDKTVTAAGTVGVTDMFVVDGVMMAIFGGVLGVEDGGEKGGGGVMLLSMASFDAGNGMPALGLCVGFILLLILGFPILVYPR